MQASTSDEAGTPGLEVVSQVAIGFGIGRLLTGGFYDTRHNEAHDCWCLLNIITNGIQKA